MLHIMDAELIEGNYVLYQGDLSTNCCWEKLMRLPPPEQQQARWIGREPEPVKKGENAGPTGPQARL
jgi:hypothetical protein